MMKYCSFCAGLVVRKVPDGDHLPRFVCEACDRVFYENPKIITGCLVTWEGQILLCKRAIEPRLGLWTVPAGFMENAETLEQAAARETWEEAGAKVDNLCLYGIYSLPRISQVYIMFRSALSEPIFAAGIESLEVRLFQYAEIPWENLAFDIVRRTLRDYLADCETGDFPVRVASL